MTVTPALKAGHLVGQQAGQWAGACSIYELIWLSKHFQSHASQLCLPKVRVRSKISPAQPRASVATQDQPLVYAPASLYGVMIWVPGSEVSEPVHTRQLGD